MRIKGILAAVLALVMTVASAFTVFADDVKYVTEVDVTIEPPVAGTKVTMEKDSSGDYDLFSQTNAPEAVLNGDGYDWDYGGIDNNVKSICWIDAYSNDLFDPLPFVGTFKKGQKYGAYAGIFAKDGYSYADPLKVIVNGTEVTNDSPNVDMYVDDNTYLDLTYIFRICFDDVPANHGYQEHVYWAVDNGIASGYTGKNAGKFGVSDNITRGQVVMILWRLAGKPEPADMKQKFKDVDSSNNFFKAVQWASEKGITGGYTGKRKGEFGPSDNCTRGQIATFLWRFVNKPEPESNTETFTDVPVDNNFYNAIQWASEQEITKGFSDGTFGINKKCTRGQCVTFLHRMVGDDPYKPWL